MDSEFSNHMIENKKLCTQLDENASNKVWFSDNNQVDIITKGSIAFKAKSGKILYMHNTLYILGLK